MLKEKTCPKKVFEFIKDKDNIRRKEIVENINFSFTTIDKALKFLVDNEYILQTRYGMYSIHDKYKQQPITIKCPKCESLFSVEKNTDVADCPECLLEIKNIDFAEVEEGEI